jgi:uncharacterized membrane protein YagU involved in acid resistance
LLANRILEMTTMESPDVLNPPRWSAGRAILVGGLVGGALDLAFAITFAATRGGAPTRLLQTVASGWLGEASFAGGLATAVLGLLSHFALSLLWAAIALAIARAAPRLFARPALAACLFGVVVFLAMRLVVLPLSAYPRPVSFAPMATALDLLSHIWLFALPIVLAVRRTLGRAAR